MKALGFDENHIKGIRSSLESGGEVELGGRAAQRIFDAPELATAGFDAPNTDAGDGRR
jgi:hypothetical protein